MITNMAEGLELAEAKKDESNMARCLLAEHARVVRLEDELREAEAALRAITHIVPHPVYEPAWIDWYRKHTRAVGKARGVQQHEIPPTS